VLITIAGEGAHPPAAIGVFSAADALDAVSVIATKRPHLTATQRRFMATGVIAVAGTIVAATRDHCSE
jgi:hypothetical protein